MSSQPAPSRFETGSLLQALLSLYGLGTSLVGAAGLLLTALIAASSSGASEASYFQQFFTLAWIALFLGLLCLPSVWFSIQRLRGKTTSLPLPDGFRTASILLLLWPVVLLVGSLLSKNQGAAAFLLPPLTILGIAIPLWWLVSLARRGLSGSQQRSWGTLTFALFFTDPFTLIVEIIVLLGLAVVVGLILSSSAFSGYYIARLQTITQEILRANGDSTRIQQILLPFLSNPWVDLAAVSIFAALIPLLEELCKSLAVWVLLGRKLSPAEGLVIGAIAGAGFALTESLFSLANPNLQDQWLILVVGRTGTGLLHITTAALVGMGLASAWRSGKFLHFVLAYLGAATLHGLWNFFSLATGMAPLLIQSRPVGRALSIISLGGMIGLSLLFFFILWSANRRLQPANPPGPALPENPTPSN